MFNMGYSISYTELRQFITSVAVYINSLQVPSPIGSYLPPEIVSAVHGGNFEVASADNWGIITSALWTENGLLTQ